MNTAYAEGMRQWITLALLLTACGTTPAVSVPATSTPPIPPTSAPAPTEAHALPEWSVAQSLQSPARSEMPAVEIEGLIYVPGGLGGDTVFQVYDPAPDTWRDLAPLPIGLHHSMAAAFEGQVYIFGGGAQGSWSASNGVFVYDLKSNEWAQKTVLPERRLGGAAVVLNDLIYIVGGVGGSNALLEYNPRADTWRVLAAMSEGRDHVAAVALEGEIYALGGRWPEVGELNSVEIYDPVTDAWRAGPSLLQARAGFNAGVLAGRIIVAGGEIIMTGNDTLTSVELFDPQTQTWMFGPQLPHPIHGVAAAVAGERFYLLGGSSQAAAAVNEGRVMIYRP